LKSTISYKCVGTDAAKPFHFNKCRSPRPLFNVVCHCSSSLMSIGIRIEKTTSIGEGCGIVCNKLYGLIYVLKLHVFQQLLKVIVVQSELEDLKWHIIRINHYLKWGELIMIQSKDWIYFDPVPRTGSICFTRYPVLSCEQSKAIWLANLLINY
jgi:hypothetical protein